MPFAEELQDQRLTVVGMLNKNRKLLPAKLTDVRERQPGITLFCFRNGATLVSHCPKPRKLVLALSTQYDAALVDVKTKNQN